MQERQKTIKSSVTVSGIGLHTGKKVSLTFKPAPENHGYKFIRTDLKDAPVVIPFIDNVVDTSRGTSIEVDGVRISTVEHVLAAVYGLGIDNILIEVSSSEIPIMDGSAKLFVKALLDAEIIEQKAVQKTFSLKDKIQYVNNEKNVEIIFYPENNFSINVMIDYASDVVANQYTIMSNISEFEKHFSNARTFVFLTELEILLKNNLIKGGDLDNAIVIIDKKINQEELDRLASIFNKPRIKVIPNFGVLNNIDLHYNNEPARHKLLDLLGDLALIGYRFNGKIIANKPGHFSNVEFAKAIKQVIKKDKSKNKAPEFDLSKPPIFDINQIMELLPHRPPFLLVDKIVELDKTSITGIKNVTMNEGFFVGHFPEEPVMPGVLQIEAMAQVGGLFFLSSVDDPHNYNTYFMTIDKVKFKRKVVPGDTIVFKVILKGEIRRGIASLIGKAFVRDNLVMEGELMAQLSKKQ